MTDADKLAVLRFQMAAYGQTFVLRKGSTTQVIEPHRIVGNRAGMILVDEIAQLQQFQNDPPQG
ncbi:hypothetical protein CK228_13725 [Mesorhizobium sp. WSM4312]|uniref:hypothetical protein n=1 Tax=Mesorhizobium sp. WSM4312 TaxID=2029411 RepID=UPI000BAFC7C5|nr:hypothetical protein [Mesorhizobium sp. WSM4312]PBB68163.1 hypothetical protein CK228_13725 [Mesorhizobium sp. WSM4312]